MQIYRRQKLKKSLFMAVSSITAIFICASTVFAQEKVASASTLNRIRSPFSSQFMAQTVPSAMEPGKKCPVSLTFKNTGKVPWITSIFVLGSQNPAGNRIWSVKEVGFRHREQIKPGQSKTFTFLVTAPLKRGIYDFQWQMKTKFYGYFGEKSVNLQIKVNSPPLFEPVGDKITFEHKPLEFEVLAKDKDADTLTYAATNLPPGANFDPSTHTFSWNPQHGQAGTYPNIHFAASDGIDTATKDISVTTLKTVVFGTIYEKNQAGQTVPLEGVNIDIMDLTRTNFIASGATDATGHFDFFYQTWQDGTYIIRASKPGYKTYSGVATLRNNSMMPFSVTLVENVPPTGSIKINNDNLYTNSTSVTLTLSATDAESGMGEGAQMQFSNDNTNWSTPESYTTTKSWTLTSGDGTKTVYVKFKDAAGNWSQMYSDTIILDTTADELVVTSGNRLMLKNSQKPYYFSSTNQYYLFYKPLDMVDEVFADAQRMGLNVIRTWGFCDGMYKEGVSFQPEAGVYSETGFARMDYLIKKARECGMRLIIPLVNNWDDFGGMNRYVGWSLTAATPRTHDQFYTDSDCKKLYKDYVEYFLNRVNTLTGIKYKDDPTILIWELANEPNCESDKTGNTLQSWIEEMAGFIKSIDNNHLVSTGSEGWYSRGGSDWRYNGYKGADYIRNNQSPNIDICSFHLLYNDGINLSEPEALEWIKEHIDDAHFVINKPVCCAEFGFKAVRPWPEGIAIRNRIYTDWYNKFSDRTIDGAGFWLLSADSYPDYDNYTVYYPQDSETCSIISNFSGKMAELREFNYFLPIILLEDREIPEDEPWEFQIPVSNPNGFSLTFSGSNLPAGATLDSNGYFRWPSPPAGVYKDIEVQVSYGTVIYSDKFNIKVRDTNLDNSPRIADILAIVIDKNTTLDNAIDLWAVTTDDETPVQNIIFNVTSSSSKVNVTLDNNRYVDIGLEQDYIGTSRITITATDQRGLTGWQEVYVAVKNNGVIRVPADYPTITEAVSHALCGDTILVASGTYTESVLLEDGISLISVSGPINTIIDATGEDVGIITGDGDTIKGFTIKNANGAGILAYDSWVKIMNNIVEGNKGGGIRCDGGSPEVINNIVVNNTSGWQGGGIYIIWSKGKVFNNIVANNYARDYGGGIKGWGIYPEIGYNDVWNNTTGTGWETNYGTCPVGEGAISANPEFSDPDYHLSANSPCLNTGHPDPKYNDKDGTRNDMGVYGGPHSF